MGQQLYSVEQVADLLGLHVKTVRGYVRDGRLQAVRIGKQYRITHSDLEAFTGRSVTQNPRSDARRTREIETSCIVQIDAIDQASVIRVTNTLMAATNSPNPTERIRVETVYDEERARLKVIILGDLGPTAELLKIVETLVEE